MRDLGKAFGGRTVLSGVDLEVASGSVLAVLGRSGSGKTTLLRIICGFERADAGSVVVDGRTVAGRGVHVAPERRRIGYVAQEGALFPHLRVAENIVFGLPWAARRARARVGELLQLVGLPADYAGRWPQELSGGEQQRVALARALAPEPRLVLLDEPFSSLDAALRVETREAVGAALRAAGATAIVVTHDQAEALSMGEAVAVLREGWLVQVAAPEVLYRQPVDAALAEFVGDAVLLPGFARAGGAVCRLGALAALVAVPDGVAEVMVRPEQIRLVPPGEVGPEQRARVAASVFGGPDALLRLVMEDGTNVRARVPGHRAPIVGEEVGLTVDGPVMVFARAGY